MSEVIAQSLARLASLNLQRRYIIHATRDEYYLPEELLESERHAKPHGFGVAF